jgi:hypothetical protein
LVQSDDGVLHYFFTFRDNSQPYIFDWDFDNPVPNGNLSYARSPDGGETWTRSDGSEYELPITVETAEVIDPIEQGYHINSGWASYDPRNNAPHIAYYRNDDSGNTQIFHGYLDDGEWITEPATDRQTQVQLGFGIPNTVGRPAITVGDSGDVHIVYRDYEHGNWPILVEKLDGEWHSSVLYKRNMITSDFHIDMLRWDQDDVFSYVDQPQNFLGASWTEERLIGVTDLVPDVLNRNLRSIDLSSKDNGEILQYIEDDQEGSTSNTSFEDVGTSLVFTESSVPGTPIYVRASVELETDDPDGSATVRTIVRHQAGRTASDPVVVTGTDATVVETDWTRVPVDFRAGTVSLQLKSNSDDATATVNQGTLEVGYYDPVPIGEPIAPHGGK